MYEYKRKTILYLCIYMMPSGKNAKTNDNEYCRHDRDSDNSDDSDTTITDDEVDVDANVRAAGLSIRRRV